MARWKLTEPHYLNVPENYWEQTQTDRDTGKQKKVKYPVPTHLDPKDPGAWTHKSGDRDVSQGGNAFTDGVIMVAWEEGYVLEHEGKVFTATAPVVDRKDLIFVGPPTPGMEPVDDEAKAISTRFDWTNIADDKYFGMSYAERLIFDKVTNEDASAKGIEKLAVEMSGLAQLMTKILERLAEAPRRV